MSVTLTEYTPYLARAVKNDSSLATLNFTYISDKVKLVNTGVHSLVCLSTQS